MKKFIIAAAMFIALTTSAFAATTAVNNKALAHFAKEFKNASNIQWSSTDVFTKASFNWNKQALEVFYNDEGEYVGTSRTVTLEALPLEALKVINNKYQDFKTTEAIEFSNAEGETNFYVSLENAAHKVALKISPYGDVSVFKKTTK